MSNENKKVHITAVERNEPELRKLARALLSLARVEIEKRNNEATADDGTNDPSDSPDVGEAA